MKKKQSPYFFLMIATIAAFAGILLGFGTAVISGAILFIDQEFSVGTFSASLIISSILLGAFVGSLFSGRLTDRIGRKNLLMIDAVLFALATLLSSLSPNVYILIIARFFVGVAIGVSSYVAPLYVSEIAPAKFRGALVALNQLTINIGILLAYTVDYALVGTKSWRWMLAIGIIPAIILLIGMFFLPYSPRWMVFSGKNQKALKILQKIRQNTKQAESELEHIRENIHLQKGSFFSLFDRKIRPALIVGVGLAVVQQVTGINTIIYFAPTVFEEAGFHNASAVLASIGVGIALVLSTAISLLAIDTLGRRLLLLIGMSFMSLGLLGLSLSIAKTFAGSEFGQILSVITMLLYIFGFSISLGPIMWVIISEVFPLKFRAIGASVATCSNWISNFLVSITFLSLLRYLGASGAFLLYFCINLLGMAFVYFYIPETKGISLEQIEKRLYSGKFFPKRKAK